MTLTAERLSAHDLRSELTTRTRILTTDDGAVLSYYQFIRPSQLQSYRGRLIRSGHHLLIKDDSRNLHRGSVAAMLIAHNMHLEKVDIVGRDQQFCQDAKDMAARLNIKPRRGHKKIEPDGLDSLAGLGTLAQELACELSSKESDRRLRVFAAPKNGYEIFTLATILPPLAEAGRFARDVQIVATLPEDSPPLADRKFPRFMHETLNDKTRVDSVQTSRFLQARTGSLALAGMLTYARDNPVSRHQSAETLVALLG